MEAVKPKMKITFIEPYGVLKPYIKSIWVFESRFGIPPFDSNLAAPNGCCKIIITCENSIVSGVSGNIWQSAEHGVYFIGNRDIPIRISTPARKTVFIGIEFYPHGAYPIFGIPMLETANMSLHFNVILEKWGKRVNEEICNLTGIKDKLDFIQRMLTEALLKKRFPLHALDRGNTLIDYCVKSLKSTDGLLTISELEQKTGYSRRYLEILFKTHIGLSPKVISGIFRFQKFYKSWARGRTFDELKNELYDFYYDQSHYVKEFKRMTGFSPKIFSQKVSNEFGRRLTLH